jgi:hypothetical protein
MLCTMDFLLFSLFGSHSLCTATASPLLVDILHNISGSNVPASRCRSYSNISSQHNTHDPVPARLDSTSTLTVQQSFPTQPESMEGDIHVCNLGTSAAQFHQCVQHKSAEANEVLITPRKEQPAHYNIQPLLYLSCYTRVSL